MDVKPREQQTASSKPTLSSESSPGLRELPLDIKIILVALDFSDAAMRARDYADALARRLSAQIQLVHVQIPDEVRAAPGAAHLVRDAAESATFVRERLAGSEGAPVPQFWPENCRIRIGRPYREICEVAREIGANLIVLASRGHTGLKRILLGSTAERVVRFAPCPVLVVRERKGDGESRDAATAKLAVPRKILVPLDFSAASFAGLNYGAALARRFGAELLLLHVIFDVREMMFDRMSANSAADNSEMQRKEAELEMAALQQLEIVRGLQCATEILFGNAVEEICRRTSQADIDLVVTSSHGRTGWEHMVLGSVAEHVVRYADCPVLVVPSRGLEHPPGVEL
jgi:nucleotide-binding universal stress UspA family protein